MTLIRSFLLSAALLALPSVGLAADAGTGAPAGKPSADVPLYPGYLTSNFLMGIHECTVVRPTRPASGNPWIWRPEFLGAFDWADRALLAKGYTIAYINLYNTYGSPPIMPVMDAFYDRMVSEYRLSRKVTLFGFSRGGLYSLNWSNRHPDRIACLYLDAPVCDFKSWPEGSGKGVGSSSDWVRLKHLYSFASDQEARAYALNPLDHLRAIAAAKISILCVCGDADKTVPYPENAAILKERYEALGGSIQVILKPGADHHPHSLRDPKPIVDFVLSHN